MLRRLIASPGLFHVVCAAAMVVGRVAFFDHQFFKYQVLPNHDMSQGLAFFCTNMHSLRTSGELAFWSPPSRNGYAQYYQSFLSPLAPTPHHVVFIAWAQLMRLLNACGVVVPEYRQYLIVNYLILPFLTFLVFSFFTAQLIRRRAARLLVMIVYAFSGIGLWNSAWFYFQESFSLFFVLGSALFLLRRPTRPRFRLFLAAALIQLTSLNYWSAYNSWFVVLFFGTHACTFPNRYRLLARRLAHWSTASPWRTAGLATLLLASTGLSLALVFSVLREQNGEYIRSIGREYTRYDAFARNVDLRFLTTRLFNPSLDWRPGSPEKVNSIHHARYLGCFLLPLLAVALLHRWTRRIRFLAVVAVGLLIICCLAPPFLLLAWESVQFTRRVVHLFYFYSHYWQTIVALLAGVGMDVLLSPAWERALKRRAHWIVGGLLAAAAAALFALGAAEDDFSGLRVGRNGGYLFAVLVGVASLTVLQHLLYRSAASARLLVGVLLTLAASDLSRYFWIASHKDRDYFVHQFHRPNPIPWPMRESLRRAWTLPASDHGFNGSLTANLPLDNRQNDFWPDNQFMAHRNFLEIADKPALLDLALTGPSVEFFGQARRLDDPAQAATLLQGHPEVGTQHRMLLVQNDGVEPWSGGGLPPPAPAGAERITRWSYNGFELHVAAVQPGWLYLRQTYDPLWRVQMDGRPVRPVRANFVGMALPISAGEHHVVMEFQPLARRLYWPACWSLEGSLALLAGSSAWRRRAAFAAPPSMSGPPENLLPPVAA